VLLAETVSLGGLSHLVGVYVIPLLFNLPYLENGLNAILLYNITSSTLKTGLNTILPSTLTSSTLDTSSTLSYPIL
jgi:hypothetical protein